MSRGVGLIAVVLTMACAQADDAGGAIASGRKDTGVPLEEIGADASPDVDLPPMDSAAADTAIAEDSSSADTSVVSMDSGTVSMDSGSVSMDSGSVSMDSGTVSMDSGTVKLGKVFIYDDSTAIPSLAPAAVTALGGTVITTTSTSATTTWDAGGFDFAIVDAPANYLPSGLDTRLVTWMKGGGRLIIAHWQLDTLTALRTELGVGATSFTTVRPIYKDASTIDFFSFPSPLTSAGGSWVVNGFLLTVTSPSFLAARFDSATGSGAIAVTHGGKVVVNGEMLTDFNTLDGDADGKKDVQELYENEIKYVLSK
jgi:hypothetical protein